MPGYEARIVDEDMQTLPPGAVGRLAVRGPTGCRYLDDPRQSTYVRDGWNLTGDAFSMDADGYFWFQARTDDMIISSGYNISGFEVEAALLEHPLVAECAVVAAPDERARARRQGVSWSSRAGRGARVLQDHVKAPIAPYKYPRRIEFVDELPRTPTGKVQRNVLRERVGMRRLQPPGLARAARLRQRHRAPSGGWSSSPARSAGTRPARFPFDDLAGQVGQALRNIVAVLAEAGAGPEHVARMTWYITDRDEYLATVKEIGAAYREVMGRNFPAMAVVEVSALIEAAAKVEIETTAVV